MASYYWKKDGILDVAMAHQAHSSISVNVHLAGTIRKQSGLKLHAPLHLFFQTCAGSATLFSSYLRSSLFLHSHAHSSSSSPPTTSVTPHHRPPNPPRTAATRRTGMSSGTPTPGSTTSSTRAPGARSWSWIRVRNQRLRMRRCTTPAWRR